MPFVTTNVPFLNFFGLGLYIFKIGLKELMVKVTLGTTAYDSLVFSPDEQSVILSFIHSRTSETEEVADPVL